MTGSAGIDPSPPSDRARRRVRRARGLPTGRAVVGALLVTAAAVATFAAYLDVTAGPVTSYLVALETVEAGTRFANGDQLRKAFGSIPVELTSPLDERAILVDELDDLVGRVLVAPLSRGDLVTRTSLVDDGGVPSAQTLSFALPREAAVGGALRPGERIDVLATYGGVDGAYTVFVVRGVPLMRITGPDGGPVGASSDVVLTVAVTALSDVQALGHAISSGSVLVTRSTAGPMDAGAAPAPFRADPRGAGPSPDPATVGGSDADPGTVGPPARPEVEVEGDDAGEQVGGLGGEGRD